MARMKQKTRYTYPAGKAQRMCKSPRRMTWHVFPGINGYATGERDGFRCAHSQSYYQRAYDLVYQLRVRAAFCWHRYEDKPLAAMMVFTRGKRAWYFYGASNNEERNRMPTYLLQWEAMRWAAARGCSEYDLWGVPDAPLEELEANFTKRHDGLWGVYRFKRGFGGQLLRSAGAWDRVYSRCCTGCTYAI